MTDLIILPLKTKNAQLSNIGGKGANLAQLAQAGLPVPDGFLVTTEAYQIFIAANALQEKILQAVAATPADDLDALQNVSDRIRGWFTQGSIPPPITTRLQQAYANMDGIPVAVRSSATTEDLPEASFAGQQDTYLNVIGEAQLLTALVNCWSSLWTARAIGYRARNGIPHAGAALAVVVQEMAPAEASGVLFTANPLSGLRTETVIDATLGLGEALVGGLVEPDHYVVEMTNHHILNKTLGAKKIAIHAVENGGVQRQELDAAQIQALPDQQILELADLGQRIAEIYHFPQDIEWAWANDQLYILQSRPITSLYPIPGGTGPGELRIFFSFASVQGILEPMTPLGQDAIRLIFAGGASLFGYQVTYESQGIIWTAGERLWGNMTPVLRNSAGRRLAPRFFGVIEPSIVPTLHELMAQPPLNEATGRPRLDTLRRLAKFIRPMLKRILANWRFPESQAGQMQNESQQELAQLQALSAEITTGENALNQSLALYRQLYNAFVYAVPHFGPGLAAGLAPLALLNRLSQHLDVDPGKALEVTRGLPHNVTTQMDLELWETARRIRSEGAAIEHMQDTPAAELADEYLNRNLPPVAQEAIADFLKRYGMRGVGEIDIGRPRWREDPTQIMQVLKSYLRIEDDSRAPDVVFQHGVQAAERAIDELEVSARHGLMGPLRVKIVRAASRRVRALAGLRESPKFYIIQMMGIIRKNLLERGEELVASGVLEQPDDLFYLYLTELEALAAGESRDWSGLVAEHRNRYKRERLRRQVPRLILSDGRTFYEGIRTTDADSDTLVGSPVSPGVVEGRVRVVLEPHNAQLEPGEILVCPATDPAWTPLFLAARGLVMEVGGMMTHGAIVAREYGIPAVVGVHAVTRRLHTGQRIRVDGSNGKVILIQE